MPVQEENHLPESDVTRLIHKLKQAAPKDSFVTEVLDTFQAEGSDSEVIRDTLEDWDTFDKRIVFPDRKKEKLLTLARKADLIGCGLEIMEVIPKSIEHPRAVGLSATIRKAYDNSDPTGKLFYRNLSKTFNTFSQYNALFDKANSSTSYDISTHRQGSILSKSQQIPSLSYRENQTLLFTKHKINPDEEDYEKKEIRKDFHLLDGDGMFGFGVDAVANYDFDTNSLTSVNLTINYYNPQNDEQIEVLYLSENTVPDLGWEATVLKPPAFEENGTFHPPFLIIRGGGAKLEINATRLHPAIPDDLSVYFPLQIPEKLPPRVAHLDPILLQFERYQVLSK